VLDIHVHDIHIGPMTKLAVHMNDAGLTDLALAEKVGCDRSMITKLRHGSATPSLPLALAISKETGVDVEALMPLVPKEGAAA
jgi:transcriptional regulator with XRE-family HTH domain